MLTDEKKKIFLSCGEVSGDMNAANLVLKIRELAPNFEFVAIGGSRLRNAGVNVIRDTSNWGTIGILESISKAPAVYPVLRALPRMFRYEIPDLFVPVDCRFFNMHAAAAAKAAGLKVVYFFAPVSWFGSGNKRFEQIAKTVDLSLVALPFSLAQYRESGANYEFIGHPLIDTAKPSMDITAAHAHFGTRPGNPVIGLMPGSRFQEIKRLTPVFSQAVKIIAKKMPGAQFILFKASDTFEPLIKKLIGDAPVSIVSGNVYDFMNLSDILMLCSGTAAHEATLLQTPMVVTYKISRFTYWLGKKTVNPPFISLPNIIAREFITPELIQYECTPAAVAEKILELLSDSEARCKMIKGLCDVASQLGEPGALDRAAKRVINAALGDIPDLRSGLAT